MHLRRAAARIATFMVAVVVALAVPVSQLRTVAVIKSCCCPDPTNCHCPDHKPDSSQHPEMRACHNTQHTVVAPQAPAFAEPDLAITPVADTAIVAIAPSIPDPHPAPPPIRPDAPS